MEKLLAPLPFPVTFFCHDPKRWPELFSGNEEIIPDPDTIHRRITHNEDCWIILTYLQLKQRGLNVHLSDRFIPQTICVASTLDFGARYKTFSSFIVGCRGDGFKPALSDFTIVQNKAQIESETEVLIPLWPQPGLIPRSPKRGNDIKNVVFKGWGNNLYESFRSPEFCQALEEIGVQLVVSSPLTNETVEWHDYSDADLVLAVRDLTEQDALVKPASKLINAWLAGVPALLGPEPAFRDLRRSPLDYIEVKTPEEVLDAIRRLQQDPHLYQQMVENGLKRAEEFTIDCIAQQWRDVLAGPVAQRYTRWRQRTSISRIGEFALRLFQQKIAISKADYHRHHGYRIISGKVT
ncbi:glycosyltransferase [Calothrix sp. PCC 7507]|uniref:glycosyltransferase n=1 Tax=Calothrix sp. PCC 7507 TaxID=99598 RepID=UPI00029F3FF7|nr:glycosyltransferase [Calothrix sp. PCC 7507]AFY35741.1 hypothetical protein Cal7507_5406 [Calothrix sp. PCC 7507]